MQYNKLLHVVTIDFIKKCTNEILYNKKGINPIYFKIRKVFEKKDKQYLEVLYDYLETIKIKNIMTVYDFFANAEKHRKYKIYQHERARGKQHNEITLDEILSL